VFGAIDLNVLTQRNEKLTVVSLPHISCGSHDPPSPKLEPTVEFISKFRPGILIDGSSKKKKKKKDPLPLLL
jgi:hypothetical protein